MWIGGVGARLAFAVGASNGAGPAIARFSVAHQITGSAAWVAALVMMALADVLILWVPTISSTSRDQAIFVDRATDASMSSDAVLLEIDRFG
jgi:hypothetical protein